MIDALRDELLGRPVAYTAHACLIGIALPCLPIKLPLVIGEALLRRPTPADLERELAYSPIPADYGALSKPTAIMEVASRGYHFTDVYHTIANVLTTLRLTTVASACCPFFQVSSHGIGGFFLREGRFSDQEALVIGSLNTEDGCRLVRLWNIIRDKLAGTDVMKHQFPLHLNLAHARYSDALLREGMFEKQVASAVMGLEGLFLTAGEKELVGLRLRQRAALILRAIGYRPLEVSRDIKSV